MKKILKGVLLLVWVLSGCAELKSIPVQLYRVPFVIGKSGLGSARVLDPEGKELKTLWKDQAVNPGPLTVTWDGRNEKGETVSGGADQVVLTLHRWDLKLVGKFGGMGSTPGRFLNPQGLSAYPQGARLTVAVADTGNNRVQLLTDSGGFLQSASEFGSGAERLDQPTDVNWDGLILTVCDSMNHRLARFDGQGSYLGEVRQLTGLQTSLTNQAILDLEDPVFIGKSAGGDFWVSDEGHGTLCHITSTGGLLEEWGSPYALNNDGPFLQINGNFWVRTGPNQVQVLNGSGNNTGELKGEPPFQEISGMAASSKGYALLSDKKQGLLYFLDGDGRVFETLSPEEVTRPGALSLWEDQLFVISADDHMVAHYLLEPGASSELKKEIQVGVLSAPGGQ